MNGMQAIDWQRVRKIRLRALADAPNAFCSTLAAEEAMTDAEWQKRSNRDNVAQFVATTDTHHDIGLVVGAPDTDSKNTAGLFGMWVAPDYRGRKVGKALIDAVINWAQNEGYTQIILDVADENTAAIRLYEASGFLPNGVVCSLPPPREHVTEHQRALSLDSKLAR